MASPVQSKKLRILLMPFFAASHIGPFTNLAIHLAAARPDVVEATVAVTTANASIVQSVLARQNPSHATAVKVATYPFPAVDGLPPGVENLSTVKAADAWRIDAAAFDEALMSPGQECLIREHSPDAIITDMHFFWNPDVAADLGVPCVAFQVIGTFATTAINHLTGADIHDTTRGVVAVPRAHHGDPDIVIPHTELPEFLRSQKIIDGYALDRITSSVKRCAGRAVNTFFDLEHEYCELFASGVKTRPTYFVGPLSLSPPAAAGGGSAGHSPCIDWLDRMPSRSVVFLCFGSLTHVSDAQLVELALGLEASGKPFLWVIRDDTWALPEGWLERVGERGMVVKGWAPQTEILEHPAVRVFVTHCGWNSVLETVSAGVPVLTWPMVFEQFIIERLLTEVLEIGERLLPEGAGVVRSTRYEENGLVPAEVVAQAVIKFVEPGGGGDAARRRVEELSARARATVAEGGSSHRDLQRLIDDLMEARTERHHDNNILQKVPCCLNAGAWKQLTADESH
ncbi:Scopoletin glucosyltransferase [Dichanthelium oligosanthes]|uniref:Glycosyltransferase n=1 Tax=Dichanthelium oligosanthes TaxID=888268 RepID=A0A1E5W7T9_9POAL|nr:Scopoletin glucosyltransferase [Dichanthelium oligosanthes]